MVGIADFTVQFYLPAFNDLTDVAYNSMFPTFPVCEDDHIHYSSSLQTQRSSTTSSSNWSSMSVDAWAIVYMDVADVSRMSSHNLGVGGGPVAADTVVFE